MKHLSLVVILLALFVPVSIQARTTPEDILNQQRQVYQQKIRNYSPENRIKLERLNKQINDLNQKLSNELEQNILRQGEILDEYVERNGIEEDGGKDGINRNLSGKVENARYWITYTHEAVAFQKAKVYVFNLTSEKNLKSDANNLISRLQGDLNGTRQKVINSQKTLGGIIK